MTRKQQRPVGGEPTGRGGEGLETRDNDAANPASGKRRGRPRRWSNNAERMRAERAERARRTGREPGKRGRVGKRSLLDILVGPEAGTGQTLAPAVGCAGKWSSKGDFGVRHALAEAFAGTPIPCRLEHRGPTAFISIVVRQEDTPRSDRRASDAARRSLVTAIGEKFDREFPQVVRAFASVPKRLVGTPHGVQRRGPRGVALMVWFGTPGHERSEAFASSLARRIADACELDGWERPTDVPFADGWRLLDDAGDVLHRPRRGDGTGARRRLDLDWIRRNVERLANPASAFAEPNKRTLIRQTHRQETPRIASVGHEERAGYSCVYSREIGHKPRENADSRVSQAAA